MNLGTCPTGKHLTDFRQCGFAGCVDLREWGRIHRYKFRLEELYKAETDPHVKGDARWFVEILCQRGLIYPKGGLELLAFTVSTDAWRSLLELGCTPHQVGDRERACCFDLALLDPVAAVLRPKKRRTYSPEHQQIPRDRLESLRQSRKTAQEQTLEA